MGTNGVGSACFKWMQRWAPDKGYIVAYTIQKALLVRLHRTSRRPSSAHQHLKPLGYTNSICPPRRASTHHPALTF